MAQVSGAHNGVFLVEMQPDVLEMAMMAPIPRSGWDAWRYHIAEKSPAVHPTKHRSVLTEARRHVGLDAQKSNANGEARFGLDVTPQALRLVLLVLSPLLWQAMRSCHGLRLLQKTDLARHDVNRFIHILCLEIMRRVAVAAPERTASRAPFGLPD